MCVIKMLIVRSRKVEIMYHKNSYRRAFSQNFKTTQNTHNKQDESWWSGFSLLLHLFVQFFQPQDQQFCMFAVTSYDLYEYN